MVNIKIFELFGQVDLKDGDVQSKLDGIDKKAEGTGGKFDKLKGIVAGAGKAMAVGIGVGVTAMVGLVNKAANTTDEIDKMSQKIGISRTAYQEWSYVLSQNGTDVDKLQVGLKTLVTRMDESASGAGVGAEAFDKLGLSAIDLEGNMKSQEQMFDETARALMGMPEGAEKSQLAFELFGKAGLELMPLLNGTEESLDDLKKAAGDMGLVLSDEAIDAGVNFTDMKDNVVKSLGAIVSNLGVQVMPMFMILFDWIIEHMPQIQEFVTVAFQKIGEWATVAVGIFRDYLLPIFVSIFEWTVENWPTIQAIIEGVFNAIKFIWDNVLGPVLGFLWDALKVVVDFVAKHFPGMQTTVENIFAGIGKAVETVTDFFSGLIDKIKDAWDWLTKWNKTDVKDKTPSAGGGYSGGGGFSAGGMGSFIGNMPLTDVTKADGSHADGLDYVPWDNYKAILHKGEKIVTARENSKSSNKEQVINLNIGTLIADDYGLTKLERKLKEIRLDENDRLGGVFA